MIWAIACCSRWGRRRRGRRGTSKEFREDWLGGFWTERRGSGAGGTRGGRGGESWECKGVGVGSRGCTSRNSSVDCWSRRINQTSTWVHRWRLIDWYASLEIARCAWFEVGSSWTEAEWIEWGRESWLNFSISSAGSWFLATILDCIG